MSRRQSVFLSECCPWRRWLAWQQSRVGEEEEQRVQNKMWKKQCFHGDVYSLMKQGLVGNNRMLRSIDPTVLICDTCTNSGIDIIDLWINPPTPSLQQDALKNPDFVLNRDFVWLCNDCIYNGSIPGCVMSCIVFLLVDSWETASDWIKHGQK